MPCQWSTILTLLNANQLQNNRWRRVNISQSYIQALWPQLNCYYRSASASWIRYIVLREGCEHELFYVFRFVIILQQERSAYEKIFEPTSSKLDYRTSVHKTSMLLGKARLISDPASAWHCMCMYYWAKIAQICTYFLYAIEKQYAPLI